MEISCPDRHENNSTKKHFRLGRLHKNDGLLRIGIWQSTHALKNRTLRPQFSSRLAESASGAPSLVEQRIKDDPRFARGSFEHFMIKKKLVEPFVRLVNDLFPAAQIDFL